MDSIEPRHLLISGALVIGIIFGFVARMSGFCLRSAVIEIMEGRPARQTAAWATAIPVAIAGTQALAAMTGLDLGASIYLSPTLIWLSLATGGFLFGVGMVLTRGCGGRHLILAAGGNLRSCLVITVLGLAAYATLRGILAIPRTWIEATGSFEFASGTQALPVLLGNGLAIDPGLVAGAATGLAILIGLLVVSRLRSAPGVEIGIFAGCLIGLLVPAAWYITGILGFDEFDPVRPESITFTAPMGEALQYLMTYTGSNADFGITAVFGTLLGSFARAAVTRSLRAEGFDTPGHMARYALGASIMGFGGVLALGCTVGAGLSGISTLSIGSVIALVSIVAGGAIGHRLKKHLFGGRAPTTVPA